MKSKRIIPILFILILSLFPTLPLIPSVHADGESWLTGWSNRKSHIINNATGAGVNYQIEFIVHYGSGTDNGKDVYCNSISQTDFDDIRWTDNDGNTLLDYWLEQKSDNDYAKFWVEVADSLSGDPVTIFMYYGNSTVDSISSGSDTFIIFEDNEDGGKYVWTLGAYTSSALVDTPVAPEGTYSRRVYGSSGVYYARYARATTTSLSASNRLAFWIYVVGTGSRTDTLVNFGEPTVSTQNLNAVPTAMCDGAGAGKHRTGNFSYMDGSFTRSNYLLSSSTWYFIEILVKSTTEADYFLYAQDGTQLANITGVSMDGFSTSTTYVYLYSGTYGSYITNSYFDAIRAGKYIDPEPEHGAWGSEEPIIEMITNLYGAGFNASTPYVELLWTWNYTYRDFFEIQNSSDGESWGYLGQSTTINYTDYLVVNGTERYYKVRACNNTNGGWDNSTFSEVNFEKVYFILGIGAGPGPTVIQNVTGEWIDYNLTEIDVLIGVHDSGDVNSTLDIDGDIYNCSEVVGAPGYRISFNWTNVDQESHCLWVVAYVFYDGNQAHDIHVELYNFTSTTWVEIGTINDAVDFGWVNSSIYDLRMPNDFINSTGAVLGRFDHVAAGNINHDIHIEFLKLQAFIPFEDGEDGAIVTEQDFFWIFIAITLSMIVGIVVWLKYEHNDN